MAFVGRPLKALVVGRIKPYLSAILKEECIDSLTIDTGELNLSDVVRARERRVCLCWTATPRRRAVLRCVGAEPGIFGVA
jgi:hypothetical protein